MRPAVFLALLFAAVGAAAVVLAAAFGWAILNTELAAEPQIALLLGGAATILFVFAVAGAWAMTHLRLVRPIETLTREIQTLSHAKRVRQLQVQDGSVVGDLSGALHDLIAKFIAAREERQKAIDDAIEQGETYKRRLETILLDLSEGRRDRVQPRQQNPAVQSVSAAHPETPGVARTWTQAVRVV